MSPQSFLLLQVFLKHFAVLKLSVSLNKVASLGLIIISVALRVILELTSIVFVFAVPLNPLFSKIGNLEKS